MTTPVPLLIGLRYWRARKDTRFVSFITLFSVLGITIGVAALILVSSVMNGLEGRLKGQILGAVPQLVITPGSASQDRLEADLATIPEVLATVPLLSSEALVMRGQQMGGVQLLGIEPAAERDYSPLASHMIQGRYDALEAGAYRILLGSQLARQLGVYPGDQVRVMAAKGARYTPMGRIPAQRTFTVAGLFEMGAQIDSQLALIHIEDARRLLRTPPQWRLYLEDAFTAPDVGARLNARWQGLDPAPVIADWRGDYGQLFAAVKMEKRMMAMLLGLIIAVAAFNIVSALVMMVTDKTPDVAILKTQGISRRTITGIFCVQGMSSALLGTALGLTIGLGLANHLQPLLQGLGIWLLPPGQPLPVIIEPLQVAAVVLGALALSFLATLYPAWRASQVNPAEVLRYE